MRSGSCATSKTSRRFEVVEKGLRHVLVLLSAFDLSMVPVLWAVGQMCQRLGRERERVHIKSCVYCHGCIWSIKEYHERILTQKCRAQLWRRDITTSTRLSLSIAFKLSSNQASSSHLRCGPCIESSDLPLPGCRQLRILDSRCRHIDLTALSPSFVSRIWECTPPRSDLLPDLRQILNILGLGITASPPPSADHELRLAFLSLSLPWLDWLSRANSERNIRASAHGRHSGWLRLRARQNKGIILHAVDIWPWYCLVLLFIKSWLTTKQAAQHGIHINIGLERGAEETNHGYGHASWRTWCQQRYDRDTSCGGGEAWNGTAGGTRAAAGYIFSEWLHEVCFSISTHLYKSSNRQDSIIVTQILGSPLYFINRDLYYAYMALTKQSFGLIITTGTKWFSPTTIRISGDDSVAGQMRKTKDGRVEFSFPDRLLMIANHQIYSDWLYLWWMGYANNPQMHGHLYIILKDTLRYLPVLGMGMMFYGFIFMSRKMSSDAPRLAHRLKQLKTRHSGPMSGANGLDPMWLLLFPEGTNASNNGRAKSAKWAEKQGIADLRHILLPRATGTFFVLNELKGTVDWVYDCTVAYEGVP